MKKANEEIQSILKKHNLKIAQKISFPQYNILPDEVQLALKILSKHKMRIQFVLEPEKK